MPAEPLSEQTGTLQVGDPWPIWVWLTDDDGDPVTPTTVTVVVTRPDLTTSTPTAVEDSGGDWRATYTLAAAGRHTALVTVTGPGAGVVPFAVEAVGVGVQLPLLAEVKTYLGDVSASDPELQDALDAEAAAQRARCRVPSEYPDDLRQALLRRVARNLAARSVPVASFTSFEGGQTATRVPGVDPEVKRLEAPYRRRTVG